MCESKGGGQQQSIDEHTCDADLTDIVQRQPQAVEDHASPQKGLLREGHAGAAFRGNAGIERIAQDDPQNDGHRERAHAVRLKPPYRSKLDRGHSHGRAQRQSR